MERRKHEDGDELLSNLVHCGGGNNILRIAESDCICGAGEAHQEVTACLLPCLSYQSIEQVLPHNPNAPPRAIHIVEQPEEKKKSRRTKKDSFRRRRRNSLNQVHALTEFWRYQDIYSLTASAPVSCPIEFPLRPPQFNQIFNFPTPRVVNLI